MKRKRIFLAAGIVCLAVCASCLVWMLRPLLPDAISNMEKIQFPTSDSIDFSALRAENPDIYAWLYIPGTDISHPVLQHEKEGEYYLSHNSAGDPSEDGALFTQAAYNSRDFSDPATIIYGHRTDTNVMFGLLQQAYSDPEDFSQHEEIRIYQEGRTLVYSVFAATPYDDRHILYYYDFQNLREREAFLDTVYSVREPGANFEEKNFPERGEQILILSTCLKGDESRRYLVLAKLTGQEGV